ncbi:uncharacterized protein LOC134783482 [Penaeus indicus]|uniref:uncharacterized protein LOC134783482 n=1 Tax=Penaeus indicus TaxID=29960 RepID=UPI00300C8C27
MEDQSKKAISDTRNMIENLQVPIPEQIPTPITNKEDIYRDQSQPSQDAPITELSHTVNSAIYSLVKRSPSLSTIDNGITEQPRPPPPSTESSAQDEFMETLDDCLSFFQLVNGDIPQTQTPSQLQNRPPSPRRVQVQTPAPQHHPSSYPSLNNHPSDSQYTQQQQEQQQQMTAESATVTPSGAGTDTGSTAPPILISIIK